jgi:hypothetical protein
MKEYCLFEVFNFIKNYSMHEKMLPNIEIDIVDFSTLMLLTCPKTIICVSISLFIYLLAYRIIIKFRGRFFR